MLRLRMPDEGGSSDAPPVRSEPTYQHQNDNDDQDGAKHTDAAVTKTIAIAAEASTKTAEQTMTRIMTRMSPSEMVLSPLEGLN